MEYVSFRHHGVSCAAPAEQARRAQMELSDANADADAADDGHVIDLWGPGSSDAPTDGRELYLEVDTASGRRFIRCSALRLVEVEGGKRLPLSPLVRRAMALPFVVGLIDTGSETAWLLDFNRVGADVSKGDRETAGPRVVGGDSPHIQRPENGPDGRSG